MDLTFLKSPIKIICKTPSTECKHITLKNASRAQHAVLTKKHGVQKIFCVIGFSMGGQQVVYIFPHFYTLS